MHAPFPCVQDVGGSGAGDPAPVAGDPATTPCQIMARLVDTVAPDSSCTCPKCIHKVLSTLANACIDNMAVKHVFGNHDTSQPHYSVCTLTYGMVMDILAEAIDTGLPKLQDPAVITVAEEQLYKRLLEKHNIFSDNMLLSFKRLCDAVKDQWLIPLTNLFHNLTAACMAHGLDAVPMLSPSLLRQLHQYRHGTFTFPQINAAKRERIIEFMAEEVGASASTIALVRDTVATVAISDPPDSFTLVSSGEYINFVLAIHALAQSPHADIKAGATAVLRLAGLLVENANTQSTTSVPPSPVGYSAALKIKMEAVAAAAAAEVDDDESNQQGRGIPAWTEEDLAHRAEAIAKGPVAYAAWLADQ